MSPVVLPVNSYCWDDITDEFFKAVQELELGELFHDELFGLFEAMSAIEMMDPKMDAGMLCNRGNKAALTFDQAVDSGQLKVQGLTYSEQISILDSTLACLVSWLEGHSLVQTVFTNLYLHKPHCILDRPLKAFCICIYKIVDAIKDFVNRGLVFEEEDFQPTVYGYRLLPDVSDQRAVGMLREVEDELGRKLRGKPPPDPLELSELDDCLALLTRIRFTRLFYQSLCGLNRRENQTSGIGECQKLLATCAELVPSLLKTIDRGIPPVDNSSDPHGGPVMLGFDPLVNQRLLPPTFPRYTRIKTRVEAYQYLDDLLARLKHACKITTCNSFHSALDMFIEMSRSNPCIVSRSVMQLLYLPQCNRSSGNGWVEALKDAARAFISPPSLSPKSTLLSNPQAKEYVDSFLNRCVRPFSNLIQLCGHNRARQRDKLAHLLEDFATLQDEAERVDVFLHNLSLKSDTPRAHLACFGTWVLYHTLRIMIMFLLSGFELELYSAHEYPYIFWYLYEFLYGWLTSSLTRADTFLSEQELASAGSEGSSKSRSQRRAKPKKKRIRPYAREITLNQALQSMCGGYYKAMLGFKLDGKLRLPHPEFDCERVRYEHRFAPFNGLMTPPPVQHSEYHDMAAVLQQSGSTSLYLAGCKHFHQARAFLDTISSPDGEVQDLLRVAKTNFVVLKLLATGHKKDSLKQPEFDFSSHHHFPIIRIH
ncbi:N-alpha-acetyltransferase 35 isoform X2 [Lycorma delicatula]